MDIVILADFCGRLDKTSNNRFIYLAEMLCDKHNVEIITSDFNHGTKSYFDGIPAEYPFKITMLHEDEYKKNVCLQRFLAHSVWAKNVKKYLQTRKKPDVIYCAVPPLSAPFEAAKYCEENGIKFIVDVQDLWPEAFKLVFNIPVVSDVVFSYFSYLAKGIYKRADHIIAVSQTYVDRVLRDNKKSKSQTPVFLGTNMDTFDNAAKNGKVFAEKPDGEVWLAYCGTLGHSYSIKIVLDSMKILKEQGVSNLKFIVMGAGPLGEEFKEYACKNDLPVVFTGRLPYEEMCAQLKMCDIAINPITKGAAQSIINKHGDYAMAGLPVVSTQEAAEYRALLEKYECGINCGADSVEDVAKALKLLIDDEQLRLSMGKGSRRLGEELFDRKTSYKKITEVIECDSHELGKEDKE